MGGATAWQDSADDPDTPEPEGFNFSLHSPDIDSVTSRMVPPHLATCTTSSCAELHAEAFLQQHIVDER